MNSHSPEPARPDADAMRGSIPPDTVDRAPPDSGDGPSAGPRNGPSAGPRKADGPGVGPRSAEGPDAGAQHGSEDADARIAELEDRWRRALAEQDNTRKRAVRDAERLRVTERARTAAEWLPVVDNLERAVEHAAAEPDAVIEGVRVVLDQAKEVLTRLGYPRRDDDLGRPFDPTRHEAVATAADTGEPEGTVVQVVQPAYGEGENQLRPALVVVAKG